MRGVEINKAYVDNASISQIWDKVIGYQEAEIWKES
jgi:hypothetical protein